MSENKTNSTPLWRELKNDISKGEWEAKTIFYNDGVSKQLRYPIITNGGMQEQFHVPSNGKPAEVICRFFGGGNKEAIANCQYTALAVNNLARLAEALTRIREASLQGLKMAANGEKFSFETLAGFVAEISGKSLTSIS